MSSKWTINQIEKGRKNGLIHIFLHKGMNENQVN